MTCRRETGGISGPWSRGALRVFRQRSLRTLITTKLVKWRVWGQAPGRKQRALQHRPDALGWLFLVSLSVIFPLKKESK